MDLTKEVHFFHDDKLITLSIFFFMKLINFFIKLDHSNKNTYAENVMIETQIKTNFVTFALLIQVFNN